MSKGQLCQVKQFMKIISISLLIHMKLVKIISFDLFLHMKLMKLNSINILKHIESYLQKDMIWH